MVKGAKRFADVMPKLEFYPDLPKLNLEEVLDKEYEVTDAHIVRDFDSKFGPSDFALLLLTNMQNGVQSTTLCGGVVVVKKIQYAMDNGLLPLIGTITYNGHYYDIN